jgi:hypothetical protein
VRRILDRDARRSVREKNPQEHVHALRRSLNDDDLLRVRDDAARAAEVIRERLAQGALAARLAVVERRRARAACCVLRSRKPARERKERHVRRCRCEVVARWFGRRLRLAACGLRTSNRCDERRRACACG